MFQVLGLSLIVLFCFFFRTVLRQYEAVFDESKARELTEQQMAAAFISTAIEIYELRHTKPDLVNAMKFESLSLKMDDLVEAYYINIEANRKPEKVDSKLSLIKY